MPEKPRIEREKAAGPLTSSANGTASDRRLDPGANDPAAELAKTRQQLEKALRMTRSLARNCARAEQELGRRAESFDLVVRHGSDLVFRLTREGRFIELSPAGQKLLGTSTGVEPGGSIQEVVARDDRDPLRAYFDSVLRGPVGAGVLVRLRQRSKRPQVVELFCRAVPHPQTQALEIVGIGCLRQPHQPADAAVDDLAFSLAHELNQPLTALALAARACSRLTHAQEFDKQELAQAIDQLADQAERAAELVRRMRQLAGRGAPCWSVNAVQELVQGAVHMLAADLEQARVSLKLHIPGALPNIKIDRIQIEQVLVNLIRNSIEAMSDTPMDRRVLTVTAAAQDAEVVLRVADTGRGLAPEITERLFEPYQTTKPQGMGLGLAVSRAILQAHAGRLWVEPAGLLGTTFCLALPLASRET
jgi:signal transduction histidine kinase